MGRRTKTSRPSATPAANIHAQLRRTRARIIRATTTSVTSAVNVLYSNTSIQFNLAYSTTRPNAAYSQRPPAPVERRAASTPLAASTTHSSRRKPYMPRPPATAFHAPPATTVQ